jgi:hypothetical protein
MASGRLHILAVRAVRLGPAKRGMAPGQEHSNPAFLAGLSVLSCVVQTPTVADMTAATRPRIVNIMNRRMGGFWVARGTREVHLGVASFELSRASVSVSTLTAIGG